MRFSAIPLGPLGDDPMVVYPKLLDIFNELGRFTVDS